MPWSTFDYSFKSSFGLLAYSRWWTWVELCECVWNLFSFWGEISWFCLNICIYFFLPLSSNSFQIFIPLFFPNHKNINFFHQSFQQKHIPISATGKWSKNNIPSPLRNLSNLISIFSLSLHSNSVNLPLPFYYPSLHLLRNFLRKYHCY